jgi:hypothetical protein
MRHGEMNRVKLSGIRRDEVVLSDTSSLWARLRLACDQYNQVAAPEPRVWRTPHHLPLEGMTPPL